MSIVCVMLSLTGLDARQNRLTPVVTPPFETYLESLRLQTGIPGLSAALVQDGEIVWERGFGFQNQESRIRATPDTPYLAADLSQTLAAVLLLQCAEQRRINLDDPMRRFGVALPESGATVRHLLSYTSEGIPGETFRYTPARFAALTPVVEACLPQPYRKTVAVNLLERLAMRDSVPGGDVVRTETSTEPLFGADTMIRYRAVLDRLAVPYKVDKRGRLTRTELPVEGITAAAGLITTVRDLARFDAALDAATLLREETQALAWRPATNGTRTPLPSGLGWFVQTYRNDQVVWHFGLVSHSYSSLVIRLPARRLTLILLANSEGLSVPFQLENGDVTRSLFATLFLRLFT